MADDIEARTIAQVAWRFIPFLILCYFVAYLDRVNVGFAKLTMDADLGLSETAFGFGAGVFFLAYFLFEVPSNIILDKVGARVWIARIMFSWGIISGAMALIPNIALWTGLSAEYTFYLLRILLGFAEAGFFPGIIFFLTLWFPASYRARIVGYFMAAIPLSSALGSPVSAALLGLDGAGGLRGWQWLFVIEALPSIILAVVTFFYLTDRPADARWLADDQRSWWGMRSDRMAEHHAPRGLAGAGGDRRRGLGLPDRSDAEDDRADPRRLWRLRFAADLLDAADGVPRGRGGRAGDRGDQLDRQFVGLFRPFRDGLDQGRDRQLRLGPRDDRRLRRGRARHHARARPRPPSRAGAGGGGIEGGREPC